MPGTSKGAPLRSITVTLAPASARRFFAAEQGTRTRPISWSGDRFGGIYVEHATHPKDASQIGDTWLESGPDHPAALAEIQESKTAPADFYEPHLVIVTGAGDTAFADDATAPLLAPENRTTLSILTPSAAVRKRA
ncbi:hypothetical protein F2P44_13660 [Massilia sp. CCM 8695]|uniref:Uncharacterized protein n=1 Tax=Massilia frigida TaxID=2609281 RepID=A0ABX0N4N3_9BURK|nr:hypothetical protein [Massilia frigida]NHZ80310.1 hypothetical protein [Massilia frigida]